MCCEYKGVAEKLASLLLIYGIDDDVCKKVNCDTKEKDIYGCIDCIISFFNSPCKYELNEVCVNDSSVHCSDFIDNFKCGRCRYRSK